MRKIVLLLLLALVTPAFAGAESEIPKAMADQSAAWNRGDVAGFMRWYAHSPDTTYTSAGTVVRGYEALQARYEKKYGTSPETMGQLRFDELKVTPLGRDHALVVGRWFLKRDGQPDVDGVFSLVWERTAEGWRILHDHTSLRTP